MRLALLIGSVVVSFACGSSTTMMFIHGDYVSAVINFSIGNFVVVAGIVASEEA